MPEPTSTGRVRRSRPTPVVEADVEERSKYRRGSVTPAAPVPVIPPAPHGDLSDGPVPVGGFPSNASAMLSTQWWR